MADFGAFLQNFAAGIPQALELKQKRAFMESQKKLLDAQIKAQDAEAENNKLILNYIMPHMSGTGGGAPSMPAAPEGTFQSLAPTADGGPVVPYQMPETAPQQGQGGIPDMASNLLLRGLIKKRFGIDPGEINYRSGMTSPTTGKPATLGLDPTGRVIREFPDFAAGQEQEKTAFNQEKTLRESFDNITKTYRDVRDSYARVVVSGEKPSAAGDLALIFNYMKMLDPGSTVREGEFANAQNSGGVPDIIRAQYNKVTAGERLSDPIRQDFLTRAEMLYNAQNLTYEQAVRNTQKLAESYGLDPKRVVVDYGLDKSLRKPPKLPGKPKPKQMTPEEEAAAYLGGR